MTDAQLELMKKWHATMALMDVSFDEIKEDIDNGDDCSAYLIFLKKHEEYIDELKSHTSVVKAALMTVELGVTSYDIEEYVEHILGEEQVLREQKELDDFNANPFIKSLVETYEFAFKINQKQYPHHTHFKFKNKSGLEIHGRLFRSSYMNMRIWLSWKDKKGKNHKEKTDIVVNSPEAKVLNYPSNVPQPWKDSWYVQTAWNNQVNAAYVIAHRVIHKQMNFTSFVYPTA